jgi:outer membrane receptor protein involved in Fe transport
LSIDEEFALRGDLLGFVGASESYVGDRTGPFVGGTTARADLPAYFDTDLHGGVRCGSWEANLYVNNLADRRGLLMGGAGGFIPNIYTYIRPRTVGLNLSTSF